MGNEPLEGTEYGTTRTPTSLLFLATYARFILVFEKDRGDGSSLHGDPVVDEARHHLLLDADNHYEDRVPRFLLHLLWIPLPLPACRDVERSRYRLQQKCVDE